MAKLVHMARTKAEKAAEKKHYDKPMSDSEDYPYGLRVRLDHEMLQKLGVTSLPKVGSKMHLHAKAHVKSVEESSHEGGNQRRHIELELRHMAVEATNRADNEEVHEGNLTGAKAAMDQALDKKEAGGKGKGGFTAPEGDDD